MAWASFLEVRADLASAAVIDPCLREFQVDQRGLVTPLFSHRVSGNAARALRSTSFEN